MPNEILGEIASCLSLADLKSLSLVSHRLESVTQCLRFTEIALLTCTVAKHIPGAGYNPRSDVVVPPLEMFLRTMPDSRRHMFATHVRSVRLEWVHAWMLSCTMSPRQPQQNEEPFSVGLAPSPLDLSGNMKLMLLLPHLPRLRKLHIHCCGPFTRPRDVLICDAFTGWLPPSILISLPFLHEFLFFSSDPSYTIEYRSLLLLLTLPCIDSIEIVRTTISGDPPDPTPAATSTVTKLVFRDLDLSTSMLLSIVQIPRALTHFSYSAYDLDGSFKLRDALSLLQGSLQYLYLNSAFDTVGISDPISNHWVPLVGSLREWPLLRTVRCPLMLLLPPYRPDSVTCLADVLPLGICELEALDNPFSPVTYVVTQVVKLLGRKAEVAPALRKVTVPGATTYQREDLRVASEAAGVEVVYVW